MSEVIIPDAPDTALTEEGSPEPPAPVPPAREPDPEPEVDFFGTFRQIKAGEKLQILKALGVDESELAQVGTPQLLAVVWKYKRLTEGDVKMRDLLDLNEEELLAAINLTEDQMVAQVNAYVESRSKSGSA
jgi:hypothetical protein